jgi:hypothetical protein
MGFRFFTYVFGLILVLCVSNLAFALETSENKQQVLAASNQQGAEIEEAASKKSFDNRLGLKGYESVENMKDVQFWLCAVNACEERGVSKDPITCFSGIFDKYSVKDRLQISELFCPLIKSPSAETRRALLAHLSGGSEDYLVETGAYLLALKDSAEACEGYIKNYVGAYGPQWNINWHKALSGCRILARVSTLEQEENDFYIWSKVGNGISKCADIKNGNMRQACDTAGAVFPF